MPKVLTRMRIDEVSAVDRGAGKGVRVLLMKRNGGRAYSSNPLVIGKLKLERYDRFHDLCKNIVANLHSVDDDIKARFKSRTLKYVATKYDDPERGLDALYHERSEIGDLVRKAFRVVTKADDDVGGDHDASAAPAVDHHISRLADLLLEGGKFRDRPHAIRHLLHNKHGAALLQRLRTHKREESSPMESIEKVKAERLEKLLDIGKREGAVALAKILLDDNDAHGLSEHEYTAILTEHAKRNARAGESPEQAFSRVFSANDADGLALRKAHAIVKAAPFYPQPVAVGGEANRGGDVNPDDPEAAMQAYNTLLDLAAEYQRKNPAASEAQSFEAVFTARENAKLAAQAHQRPTPTTFYEFPR